MINRFRKASVVNTNTITIWFFLYRKCVLPKASCRYISRCCSLIFFFLDVFLWVACTPSECQPWRKRLCFVVCKPFDSYNVQFTPLVSDEWQAAAVRGCNTFWYEVFHQVPFSSSPLKLFNVWHWWMSETGGLISICLIFELTGTCR